MLGGQRDVGVAPAARALAADVDADRAASAVTEDIRSAVWPSLEDPSFHAALSRSGARQRSHGPRSARRSHRRLRDSERGTGVRGRGRVSGHPGCGTGEGIPRRDRVAVVAVVVGGPDAGRRCVRSGGTDRWTDADHPRLLRSCAGCRDPALPGSVRRAQSKPAGSPTNGARSDPGRLDRCDHRGARPDPRLLAGRRPLGRRHRDPGHQPADDRHRSAQRCSRRPRNIDGAAHGAHLAGLARAPGRVRADEPIARCGVRSSTPGSRSRSESPRTAWRDCGERGSTRSRRSACNTRWASTAAVACGRTRCVWRHCC